MAALYITTPSHKHYLSEASDIAMRPLSVTLHQEASSWHMWRHLEAACSSMWSPVSIPLLQPVKLNSWNNSCPSVHFGNDLAVKYVSAEWIHSGFIPPVSQPPCGTVHVVRHQWLCHPGTWWRQGRLVCACLSTPVYHHIVPASLHTHFSLWHWLLINWLIDWIIDWLINGTHTDCHPWWYAAAVCKFWHSVTDLCVTDMTALVARSHLADITSMTAPHLVLLDSASNTALPCQLPLNILLTIRL